MAEQLFEFDTSKERKEVEEFDKSLDRLMQTMNKLDRGSLSRFEDEWKKLRDSNNRSVQGMVENNTRLVKTLKDQLSQLERFSREKLKSFSDVKVFQQLSKDAKSNADLIRSALKTLGVELDTLDKKAESAKWAQFFKNFETGVVKADKSVREWSDRLKAQMQSAEKSMGVATPAAARARAEGYTNAFGVFITKGVQDAEDAAFKKLAAGSNGVATQAAARSRAEGYTNAFGMYISKGLQEKEAAAFKALSAGSTGVAVQAAARARAEGYTNAFGVYISKSIQDQVNRVEASASRALSAGAGGVAAQAAARARVAGSTNSLGVFTASNPIPVIPNLTERTNDVNKFSSALKKLTKDGGDAHSMARGLASGFNLLWLTWGNLLPLFVGAGLSHGFMETAKGGMEVAHTMQTIASLGKETSDTVFDVQRNTSTLTDELIRLGNNGIYGPKQVAESMQVLSLAGLKANEVLAVTGDVMRLAVAGTTDIKTAADVLVSITTAFGTGANGFAQASDVMVRAAADSKASIESIGESIKTASVAHEQYGASLTDVAGLTAMLANLGITGTAAGTAIRNMFVDMSERTTKVAKIMKEFNLDFRDSATGAMKPLLENVQDLDQALRKMTPIAQKNVLQNIFSERGGKAIIAALAEYRKQVVDVNGNTVAWSETNNKLAQTLSNIANSAGDAAIAAAEMSSSTLNVWKSMSATLQTTLFKAFRAIEPELYLIGTQLRSVFSSPEAVTGITNLVLALARLAEMVVNNIDWLGKIAIAFGAYKVAAMTVNGVTGLLATGSLRLLQIFPKLAAESGVAAGALTTLAVAKDKNAIADAKAATAAAAAAGASASRLGIMARLGALIPGIGTAVTIASTAWMLYEIFLKKSNVASEDFANKKSRDVADALKKETDFINAVTEARGRGLTKLQAELEVRQQLERQELNEQRGKSASPLIEKQAAALARLEETKEELAKAPKNSSYYEQLTRNVEDQTKTYNRATKAVQDHKTETMQAGFALLSAQNNMRVASRHAAQADEIERKRDAEKSQNELQDMLKNWNVLGNGKGGFGNAYVEGTQSALDNSLQVLEKAMNRRISIIDKSLGLERATIEAQQSAGLITEGQYQAALLALETNAEERKLSILKNSQRERADVYEQQIKQIQAAIDTAKKAKRNDTAKKEQARLDSLKNSQLEFNEAIGDQIKIAVDTRYQKLEQAAAKARGSVYKLKKEEEDFWKKDEDEERKARALEQVEERYRGVFDSIFSFSKAEMESEKARTAALEASEDRLVNLRNKYAEAKAEADSFYTNSGMEYWNMEGGFIDPQVQKQYDALVQKTEDMAVLMRGGEVKGHESATRKATAAFEKVRKDQLWSLSGTLADAVTTGLTEGGKQGSQKIRDYITSALKQRFTIGLQGVFNNLLGSVFGIGGSGGVSGAASTGSNLIGMALQGTQLYTGLTSGTGILGSIGSALGLGKAAAGLYSLGTGATGLGLSTTATGLGLKAGTTGLGLTAPTTTAASGGGVMSGISNALSAIPAWGWAAMAVVALGSILSKKATPHIGGGAAYGASIGEITGVQSNKYMNWTIPESAYITEVNKSSLALAKSVSEALDNVAASFGQKTGYIVGTGFADDTSKDGAWGSLRIALGDVTNVIADWGNPDDKWAGITFADGEEGAKQYAQKIASTVMEVINGMDLPQWAARIAKNAPSEATMDDLSAVLESISTMPARMLESFGTSRDTLVQQYAEGLAKGDPTAAGQSVADALVDSIRNSVFTNAAGAIFDIVNTGIVTPVLDAMLNGAALSEALSEAAIQATIDKVKAQAEILNALYTNTEFTSVLETMRNTVSSALGMGGQAVRNMPNTILASTADNLTSAAKEADKAAEEAQSKWEDITNSLKDEALQLSIDLLRAQGQEEAAVNKERDRAIKGFDAYQTGLYDANRATEKLIATLDKQKEVADALANMTVNFSGDAAKEILEYERIAKSLGKYDIGLSIETLMGANRESIYAAAAGFVNLSGASEDAKLAVIEAANSLLTLKDNAQGLNESLTDTAYSAADKLLGKQDAFNFRAAILAEKYTASVEGSGDPARIAQITEMFQNATPEQVKAATLDLLRFGNLSTAAKTSLIDLSTSLLDLIESSEQATNALKKQAEDLMEWVKNLAADKAGLATPAEQLLARGTLYRQDYAAAMSGDEDAISRITNTAQKYIDAQKVATTSSSITESVINQIIAEMTALANKIGGGGFSIPHFATGGYHGGGWAVVGENGRELVNMGASRVYSNADSRGLLDLGPLLAEMRATRASIEAYGAMQVSAVRDASVLNSASQEEMAEDVAEAVGVAVNNAAWMQQSKPKLK